MLKNLISKSGLLLIQSLPPACACQTVIIPFLLVQARSNQNHTEEIRV